MAPKKPSGENEPRPRGDGLRTCGALLSASALFAALVLTPETASAQTTPGENAVTGDVKGVVGGALLGAEVVDLTLGIIGIEAGWPYLVFGALGAAGGGVGGYFVEQETREVPEVPLYMLAGGMALIIPTVVVSLNATMYKPPEGNSTTTFEPATNEPAQSPAEVQPPTPAPPPPQTRGPALRPQGALAAQDRSSAPLRAPLVRRSVAREQLSFSLFDLRKDRLALSVPAVQIRPLYSSRELWKFGVSQGTEVRVPIFYASF